MVGGECTSTCGSRVSTTKDERFEREDAEDAAAPPGESPADGSTSTFEGFADLGVMPRRAEQDHDKRKNGVEGAWEEAHASDARS